jgi:hypothetical protein
MQYVLVVFESKNSKSTVTNVARTQVILMKNSNNHCCRAKILIKLRRFDNHLNKVVAVKGFVLVEDFCTFGAEKTRELGRIDTVGVPATNSIRYNENLVVRKECILTTTMSLLRMGDHVGLLVEFVNRRGNDRISEDGSDKYEIVKVFTWNEYLYHFLLRMRVGIVYNR